MSDDSAIHASTAGQRFVVRVAVTLLIAVVLTVLFWLPLWQGGGFVGGDVYSYYFPQKVFYAESLQNGEFPFWNNRTGHGYPLIGESQTGAFYPFHMLFYHLLDVNTAYNVNHLLHYVLAFVATVLFAIKIGLRWAAALFAGLVYTYGWFPARSCVEWAIIGGAWLPAALWCAESFLKSRQWRFAIGLSFVTALQLLAGHFQIAWITVLVVGAYVPLRIWSFEKPSTAGNSVPRSDDERHHQAKGERRWRLAVFLAVAVGCGYALAAMQLLPTWELKDRSQRATVNQDHELTFGSIPAWYLAQMIRPFHWYSPLVDRNQEFEAASSDVGDRTNQVEAHLYFGLIPLALALRSIVFALLLRDRKTFVWIVIGAAALLYTTGWLLPLTQHLPGFRYFQGPGRYGIAATLAVAVLAARALDDLLAQPSLSFPGGLFLTAITVVAVLSGSSLVDDVDLIVGELNIPHLLTWAGVTVRHTTIEVFGIVCVIVTMIGAKLVVGRGGARRTGAARTGKLLLGCSLFAVTICDLWIVSRMVKFSEMVADPPIQRLSDSPVRTHLAGYPWPVRMYAPGANFPTVLGVASTPTYLTFGPAEYVDRSLVMPEPPAADDSVAYIVMSPEQIEWLLRAGVTHLLSFKPLALGVGASRDADASDADLPGSPVKLIWQGDDPVLNAAWARFGKPLYLYELPQSRGRVAWADPRTNGNANVVEYSANRVVISASSNTGGRLVLTDLHYPGWSVTIDGRHAEPLQFESMFRAVDMPAGRHTVAWNYTPTYLYWGSFISGAAFLLLAAVAHVRYWHPSRLRFLDTEKDKDTDS